MSKRYDLFKKSDMRKFELDLKKSAMNQANNAIKQGKYDYNCPNCNNVLKLQVGENKCPHCGQVIDLNFDPVR